MIEKILEEENMSMNEPNVKELIARGETLTVEFKSDRTKLPDRELVAALVGLANTDGGSLFLGVEDGGTPTGLHVSHSNLAGLPAMVANNTVPALSVVAESLEVDGVRVWRIKVPRYRQLV